VGTLFATKNRAQPRLSLTESGLGLCKYVRSAVQDAFARPTRCRRSCVGAGGPAWHAKARQEDFNALSSTALGLRFSRGLSAALDVRSSYNRAYARLYALLHLHLNIDARRQVQVHKRVDELGGRVVNVKQSFVNPHFELLAGILMHE
jgi:hypothetical protein